MKHSRFFLIPLLALLLAPSAADAKRSRVEKAVEKAAKAVTDKVAESLVQAPVDQEVCFTPGERCEVKLIRFVQSARKSIDVAVYDINLDQLVHELLKAARALPVRVVVDRRQAKGEKSLVRTLIKGGIEIRYGRQRGIMHNKFIIVDRTMVETGSFNYTNGAAFTNHENQVYLSSPQVVTRFNKRFGELWNEGFRVSGGGLN